MTSAADRRILILGIGNVLWADEGFGVRAVETLHARYQFPDQVELMDGGTQGLYLVPHVQAADVLIIFDAIDYGLEPASLKVLRDSEVPSFLGAKKMSLHQTGFQEVLALAELLGDAPDELILIGVQPQELEDYGGSLRPAVRAQIDPAIDIALAELARLGIAVQARAAESSPDPLSPNGVHIEPYEAERPSSELACRHGDSRILNDTQIQFDPKAVTDEPLNLSVNVDQRRQD